MATEHPLQASTTAQGEATGELSTFTDSSARSSQTFSLEQARHELRATGEAHKQALELERQRHDLSEAAKDNDQRRLAFYIVLAVLVLVLLIALLLATRSSSGTTRAWAQGIVSTIMGGVVGGVAGYFTGKSSR